MFDALFKKHSSRMPLVRIRFPPVPSECKHPVDAGTQEGALCLKHEQSGISKNTGEGREKVNTILLRSCVWSALTG